MHPVHTILHPGMIVQNNHHFDTTRANIEVAEAAARDLVIAEGRQPSFIHPRSRTSTTSPKR